MTGNVFFLQANYNAAKLFSADHPKAPSSGESSIVEILKQRFPKAQYIEVQDISGKALHVKTCSMTLQFL